MRRALLLLLFCGCLALAQLSVQYNPDSSGTPTGLTIEVKGDSPIAITGMPYSAIETLTSTLPDGTQQPIKADRIYRDSMGRTRSERPQIGRPFTLVEVIDPVAGYRYVLDPENKFAHRMPVHVESRAGNGPRPCYTPLLSRPTALGNGVVATNEPLGASVIEGVSVCGMRTIFTYPAGSMYGNDRPVNTIQEDWTASEDIGFLVLAKNTNPHGALVSALKDVSRGDPDPALFQPPQDWRVVDETGPFTIALPSGPERPHRTSTVIALTGLPYSAEQVTTYGSELADGTRLGRQESTFYYRDAMGRTRQEPSASLSSIDIVDPIAGYRYRLDPTKQIAYRTVVNVKTKPAASATAKAGPTQPPVTSKLKNGVTSVTEDLGAQTIDGFVTSGIRSTKTYPAGTMGGNDRPLTYMNEGWFSPQLQLTVRGQSSDPMSGHAASTLKNIKLAEPAPELFRVPDGYRIVAEPDH